MSCQPGDIAVVHAYAAVGRAARDQPRLVPVAVDPDHANAGPLAQGRVVGGPERVRPVRRALPAHLDALADPEPASGRRSRRLADFHWSLPAALTGSEHRHSERVTFYDDLPARHAEAAEPVPRNPAHAP